MNARRIYWRLVEKFDSSCEIELRIRRNQNGDLRRICVLGHNDGGSLSGCQQGAIFRVGKECQLAGFRILDSSDAGDFDIRATVKFAAQTPGDLAKFHNGSSHDLFASEQMYNTTSARY